MVAFSRRIDYEPSETGSSLIQATFVLLLMFIVFFGIVNIGLTYYSMTTVDTQIQGALARIDLKGVASSTNKDDALKKAILSDAGALVAENLFVENTKVTVPEGSPETKMLTTRDSGSGTWGDNAKMLYIRDDIILDSEITYYVPMMANVPGMGRAVLHKEFEGSQCVKTRIEIFQ